MSILNVIWCALHGRDRVSRAGHLRRDAYSIAAYTAMHHYLRNLDSAVTVREDLRSLSDQNLKLASIDPRPACEPPPVLHHARGALPDRRLARPPGALGSSISTGSSP